MPETEKLERGLGLIEATSLNMTFMVGIGPFIVIPFIIRAMGGPQCILAWLVGAVLAALDGCVWAELGAAMPQAGGSYVFLREAYGANRLGRLMSFLYIWQTLFQAPLSISSGALGFADYSQYLAVKIPGVLVWLNAHVLRASRVLENYDRVVAVLLITVAVALLYRRITAIGKISTVLWVIVLGTILWLVYGGVTHFNAANLFTYPAGTWHFSWIFFAGLGHASVQTVYSYLGYYNVCNLGGEMKDPGKNIPRAIFLSISGIAILYFLMQTSILGVVPWREAQNSRFRGERIRRTRLRHELGDSRDGSDSGRGVRLDFFRHARLFARALRGRTRRQLLFRASPAIHPTKRFPHISLLALGATSIVICLIFQSFLGDSRHPGHALPHPIRGSGSRTDDPASPLESGPLAFPHVALSRAGLARDCRLDRHFCCHGTRPMLASLAAMVAGILVYLGRARMLRQWPFEEARLLNWIANANRTAQKCESKKECEVFLP